MLRVVSPIALLVAVLAILPPVAAQEAVPAPLAPWVDWVLEDAGERRCPMHVGDPASRACAWPGVLEIDADARGARFAQRWRQLDEGAIPLPGDRSLPPEDVRADGRIVPVSYADGRPRLLLPAGEYRIEGVLRWTGGVRPSRMPVPAGAAIVSLTLDGRAIATPQRTGDALWLGQPTQAVGADTLSVKVFRLLADQIPARLTTTIELQVAGRAREAALGTVLPEGFAGTEIRSPIPVAIDRDGMLRAQVRPGTWTITLDARALDAVDAFAPPANTAPWPEQEVWGFAAVPSLRTVQPQAPSVADPAQVGAPWDADVPTFVLGEGEALTLALRSRGRAEDAPTRLSLQRELWLDFDGDAFTARDRIDGDLAGRSRLDLRAPWQLERAASHDGDLLVTRAPGDEAGAGVELRGDRLALDATARAPRGGTLPATGWDTDFESAHVQLHLPPGWRLLAATGADHAPGSWLARWSLLDIFLVCLAVLLAQRVAGVGFAAIVLAYLLLAYHEPLAPLWTLLLAMAFALALKWLPAGRAAGGFRVLRGAMLALAALWGLAFAGEQFKLALYPQLEFDTLTAAGYGGSDFASVAVDAPYEVAAPMVAAEPAPQSEADAAREEAADGLERVEVTGSRLKRTDVQQAMQYPLDARVQAGSGLPSWQWRDLSLGWSGPVTVDQELRLLLSPPWLTRTLRVLAVVLLGLAIWRLVARPPVRIAGGALLAVSLLAAGSASAQSYPSAELLDELRERLLAAPECAPECASLAQADVSADAGALSLSLLVHAQADVAVPLPDSGSAALTHVRIDGEAAGALLHAGQRWVAVPRGVHVVQVQLAAGDAESVELRFPLSPAAVSLSLRGWDASGVAPPRLDGDTLRLTRQQAVDADAGALRAPEFPPYVRVSREIGLGLTWTVRTTVQRIAPERGGFAVSVPLIEGERPADETLRRADDGVRVVFGADQNVRTWTSTLEPTDTLHLAAPPLSRHVERWRVVAGAYWHVAFDGVPVSAQEEGAGNWVFHPLPGEVLAVAVTRPEAVPGDSLAIDRASLQATPGQRATDVALDLSLRATLGGQHAIALPGDAELLAVHSRGQPLALRLQDGVVQLPIVPGAQDVRIEWREPRGVSLRTSTKPLALDAPASNLSTRLTLPPDRWLLWASGPGAGPAVLYWPLLALMLLVAYALSRLALTPLRFHHWLLLGIGFSAVSWVAAMIVAGWLLLLGWRARHPGIAQHRTFALVQLGLIAATVVALFCLIAAIPYGLLGQPQMHVAGAGSYGNALHWFLDRADDGALPAAHAVSLPLWAYKAAMLLWALWLANALIGWLRWGWQAFGEGGAWPPRRPKAAKPPEPSPPANDR